jgi:hypothetical protein
VGDVITAKSGLVESSVRVKACKNNQGKRFDPVVNRPTIHSDCGQFYPNFAMKPLCLQQKPACDGLPDWKPGDLAGYNRRFRHLWALQTVVLHIPGLIRLKNDDQLPEHETYEKNKMRRRRCGIPG